MKIKKYEATTEQEAMEKVKNELGPDALVLSIKKTQPKGLFAIFKKPSVEITAAYEDKEAKDKQAQTEHQIKAGEEQLGYFENRLINNANSDDDKAFIDVFNPETFLKSSSNALQNEKIKTLEKKLNQSEEMLQKAVEQLTVANRIKTSGIRHYENNMLQVFYEALTGQGVLPEIAAKVLDDIALVDDELDLTTTIKIVYNTLIVMLGESYVINTNKPKKHQPYIYVFMGPTGVGKTTTLAKLSSQFILNNNLKVGFITADTYRIAAVAQLKTYAEILGIETEVIYNNNDLEESIKKMKEIYDVVMIDTAGRSHANSQNVQELEILLKALPKAELFLVLSATTKYEDLITIIDTYSQFCDFSVIFTKTDETNCLGSLLNICYLTGKRVSFITNGQNVPDDIDKMRPEKIAKALMGLGGVIS